MEEDEKFEDEFEEMIHSMEHIADYDGEFILNTVLDNYKNFIKEKPSIKKKLHKFLNLNEKLRELTKKQIKLIETCKEWDQIKKEDVEKLIDINAQKEEIILQALKLFPDKKTKKKSK